MVDYEQLGVFYLGKKYDLDKQQIVDDELILYESRDLLTHAVCVGMTGSGKTGLCIDLLEEAAIDNIPVIAIDPKGDLSNLLLTFPDLQPKSFQPWVDPDEARRSQISVDELAKRESEKWSRGLADWQQDGSRIQLLKNSAEFAIYTPASSAGIPLSVVKSFSCPDEQIIEDRELLREQISSTATSILALLGISGDPLKSKEHILLSSILDSCWRQGQDLDLYSLIERVQNPPLKQVGAIPLESFFSKKDRYEFAMSINNLIASPGFEAWLEGEALDIDKLFYSETGKNKVSVISISHLPDAERMFFVSLLLSQLVSWMRRQSGTSSLRAIFYMDEILGYFPPVANPPSKTPLITLLKQARAFGLGVVLATQNPVDLDYKALGNTGTWFIGRLQTERDKLRVLDGLEGAASDSGTSFNRAEIDKLISGLSRQVFLMNNVHQKEPLLFKTRWSLSYLKGPLSRAQLKQLKAPQAAAADLKANVGSDPKAELAADSQAGAVGDLQAGAAAQSKAVSSGSSASVPKASSPKEGTPVPDWLGQLADSEPAISTSAASAFASSRANTTRQAATQNDTSISAQSESSSGFFTANTQSSSTANSQSSASSDLKSGSAGYQSGSSSETRRNPTGKSLLPPGIIQKFARVSETVPEGSRLIYKPMLYASAQLRFTDSKSNLDLVQVANLLTLIKSDPVSINWEKGFATKFGAEALASEPEPNIEFADLAPEAAIPENYKQWNKDFIAWLTMYKKLELLSCPITGVNSSAGESERDFRICLQQNSREKRDELLSEVSEKYTQKLSALEDKLAKAHQNLNQEQSQERLLQVESSVNVGASIFQALVGRKVVSSTNIRRATSAANKMARVNRQHLEVEGAQATVDRLEEQLDQLQSAFAAEMSALKAKLDPGSQELEKLVVGLKKSNIILSQFCLCWAPCIRQPDGKITKAW